MDEQKYRSIPYGNCQILLTPETKAMIQQWRGSRWDRFKRFLKRLLPFSRRAPK
jgi:hypothetical protein